MSFHYIGKTEYIYAQVKESARLAIEVLIRYFFRTSHSSNLVMPLMTN
jgi:hypothetical protein